ncbi:MAG: hypothetical protein R2877_07540 [Bdellovibrionota bacterium]
MARTKYYSHGGGTVYNEREQDSRDFVEAPSQMLRKLNLTSESPLLSAKQNGCSIFNDMLKSMLK